MDDEGCFGLTTCHNCVHMENNCDRDLYLRGGDGLILFYCPGFAYSFSVVT